MAPRDRMLPLAARRQLLDELYRTILLRPPADELAGIKAQYAENGTTLADEARAAAEAGGDRHGTAEPLD